MDQTKETPRDVEKRAETKCKEIIAKYGFPPAAEAFMLNTYPVFAREIQAIFLSGTPPQSARSIGVIMVFNALKEIIEATTPPADQDRVFEQSCCFIIQQWRQHRPQPPAATHEAPKTEQ